MTDKKINYHFKDENDQIIAKLPGNINNDLLAVIQSAPKRLDGDVDFAIMQEQTSDVGIECYLESKTNTIHIGYTCQIHPTKERHNFECATIAFDTYPLCLVGYSIPDVFMTSQTYDCRADYTIEQTAGKALMDIADLVTVGEALEDALLNDK